MATRLAVQKTNFIEVMSAAVVRTFTPENIHVAFQRIGVIPFNPKAISAEDMAPSIKQSCKAILPLRPSSPVQAIAKFMKTEPAPENGPITPNCIQQAVASTLV